MITVEPLLEWQERQVFEEVEVPCRECDGDGDCICGRECRACGGSGIDDIRSVPEGEIEQRYFNEVMDSLRRLCAFSSRHDFLIEAGDFIKAHGRLDLPAWRRTTH